MTEGAFEGFGPKALPFLKALGFHQSREWFAENRALYEKECREPLRLLLDVLTARFAAEGLPLSGTLKTSSFRINRDVRFSKAKHPYNTHVSAVLTRTGTKKDIGGVYVHVAPVLPEGTLGTAWGPPGSFLAAGAWQPEPDVLHAMRTRLVERPAPFLRIADDLAAKGYAFDPEAKLVRLPRGFTHVEDERIGDLLRHKGFTIERTVDEATVTTPALVDAIVDFAHDAMPLLDWYWRVGDPVRAAREGAAS